MISGLLSLAGAAILVVIDQLIKHWATAALLPVGSMDVLPGVVELRYCLNDGMAFSMLAGKQGLLIGMTSVMLLAVLIMLFVRKMPLTERAAWTLVLGGGVGNLIDRVLNGVVVDYINVLFMRFAIFNFADICVCVGVGLLMLAVLLDSSKRIRPQSQRRTKMERLELTAAPGDSGRLDAWLAGQCPTLSRSALQNLIEQGLVTCGGAPVNKKDKVEPGKVYAIDLPDPQPIEARPQNIPLDIVYEDDDLLVVNKPKGMVVHPAPGNPDGTLVNALLYHCAGQLSGIGGAIRPGIVHRIDKDTSGLLVVAKNDAAHQALSAQMSVHSIHRVYHAVVYGNLKEDEGFVEKWLGRDPRDRKKMAVLAENAAGAKYAYTGWQVLERCGNFTYIACKLKTGRTHQIRVHMASTGHPLAGDAVYGPKNCIKSLNGQCLHAKELGFVHPRTGEWMQFDSPLPPYFTEFLTRLRKEHRA